MAIPIVLDRPVLGREVVDAFEGAIRDEGFEPRRRKSGFVVVPGSVRELPEGSSLMFSIPFEEEAPLEKGTYDVWIESGPLSDNHYFPEAINHFDDLKRLRIRVFKNSKRSWSMVFQQINWVRRQRPRMFWPWVCVLGIGWIAGIIRVIAMKGHYRADITRRINSVDDLEGGIAPKVKAVLLRAFDQLKLEGATA